MLRIRKLTAMLLCLVMLTACTAEADGTVSGSATRTTQHTAVGTVWNAVADFGAENTGVWRYVYAAQADEPPVWSVCTDYREAEGSGVCAWFAPDDPEVSVGISEYVPGYLEITASGTLGRMAGLQFTAPSDGAYALSGVLHNEWAEEADDLTVLAGDRKVYSAPVSAADVPFSVTLTMQAGETLTLFCRSQENGNWLALYWQAQIEYLGRNET